MFAGTWGALIFGAMLLDKPVYDWAAEHYSPHPESDTHRSLRVLGYWPLWVAAAIALLLIDRPLARTRGVHAAITRGSLLTLGPGMAAALVEILKVALRRERPGLNWDGHYVFRAFGPDWWRTSDLALPSSHAAVAFGAAFVLGRLFPGTRFYWLMLAAGCGMTRLAGRAHVLSDVAASVPTAYVAVAMLMAMHLRVKNRCEGPMPGAR